MSKIKTQDLNSLKTTLEREIRIGGVNDKLTNSTVAIYVRQLTKIYKTGHGEYQWTPQEFIDRIVFPRRYDNQEFQEIFKVQKSDVIALLFDIYKSKESLIMTLNALCKMTKNRYREAFDYYNTIRKELTRQNKAEKLDNELTPEQQAKYISYKELMSIPEKVKTAIVKKYNKLYLSKEELDKFKKSQRADYLRAVFDYITLYLNVHHPIRLVWPTVNLVKQGNYLEGNKLYLNDFKNVRLMGPQVLELDKKTMNLINEYLSFLKNTLGEQPTKLLYRLYNNKPAPYDYQYGTGGFSQVIAKLFQKYNGKPINMNTIRHIVESHIIQSPEYAKMTNREKQNLHTKLLHSAQAANLSYNKIVRDKQPEPEPDFALSYEPEVIETTLTRRRKGRVYRGDFKLPNSDRELEIEIFEK